MDRKQFEEMLKEFQAEQTYRGDDTETFAKYEKELKLVASGLSVDKHRWYETSTTVYAVGEWYLGLNEVTDVFSEQMGISDCEVTSNFFEMEAQQSTTYVPKKQTN